MNYFDSENVNLKALKKKAYNFRWAEVPEGMIPLTAADPDYPCAPAVKKAMQDYIEDGYFSYTPKSGLEEFKSAFSDYVKTRKNEDIRKENVLPVDSAARAMYIIAKAFLKPGDEMIVFDPCDFLFRESCLAAGAVPVYYPAKLDTENRKMDLSKLEDYITDKTKMLGLCNPHNPYGLVYTKEDLDHIMCICEKHDILIMNDEIWSDIVYPDAAFHSIYCLGNDRCRRVLSVFGYSKSFGLAGLRIGCVYASDKTMFEQVVAASDVMTTAGGAASISQVAAVAAMNDAREWLDDFIKHLTDNRDFAVNYINQNIPGLIAYKPEATYLLYVNIKKLGMSAADFVEYLKGNSNLAIIPGGHQFFGEQSEGYVRICIATSREILEEALKRLKEGVELLASGEKKGTDI